MTARELMLTHILDCPRIDLYVDPRPLNAFQLKQLETMEMRLKGGEPLQYILGSCEFMGLNLWVDERVFIPRPETEVLIEAALEKIESLKNQGSSPASLSLNILDLGCGSGNIAISLAQFCEACGITTIDCSQEALEVAQCNAKAHHLEHKIAFLKGDLFEPLGGKLRGEKFHLLVSNPPYIPTAQLRYLPNEVHREPVLALDGGWDGLDFYRRIFSGCGAVMNPGGLLILEIGEGQRSAVQDIVSQHDHLQWMECRKDLCGRDRVVVVEVDPENKFWGR